MSYLQAAFLIYIVIAFAWMAYEGWRDGESFSVSEIVVGLIVAWWLLPFYLADKYDWRWLRRIGNATVIRGRK